MLVAFPHGAGVYSINRPCDPNTSDHISTLESTLGSVDQLPRIIQFKIEHITGKKYVADCLSKILGYSTS